MNIELQNFLQKVNDIYGLYRDAVMAFQILANDTKNKLKQIPPNVNLTTLPFSYAESRKEIDDGKTRHNSTADDYIKRNELGGANHVFMANFCIVLIYAYWEYYRGKITTGQNIKSDLMCDIKDIRIATIHKKGILHKKLKVLKFLEKDRIIKIDKDLFDKIVDFIKTEIKSIKI